MEATLLNVSSKPGVGGSGVFFVSFRFVIERVWIK